MRDCCPRCGSKAYKKNGYTHTGKQNHQCLECMRQFVLDPEDKIVPTAEKSNISQTAGRA